jgi:hypothetical protein
LSESKDFKDHRVNLFKDSVAFKESKEYKAARDCREFKDSKGCRGGWDFKGSRVYEVRVFKAPKAKREILVYKDLLESKGLAVTDKAPEDSKVSKAYLGVRVYKV